MIKQRNGSDCVIAAVANAAGVSYAAVKRVCGSTRGGLEEHEVDWLLSRFSGWRKTFPRKTVVVADWLRRHRMGRYVLVLDVSCFSQSAHAIACVDGEVMGEYRAEWSISEYYTLEV